MERNPEKQEEEEEKEETEPSDQPPAEENNTLMNKTARKRPLFSQTCNTLLGTLCSKMSFVWSKTTLLQMVNVGMDRIS